MENITDRITINQAICNGKPTIRNKRITVNTILEFLSAGETPENILLNYPMLEKEDIEACLAFAAKMLDRNFIIEYV